MNWIKNASNECGPYWRPSIVLLDSQYNFWIQESAKEFRFVSEGDTGEDFETLETAIEFANNYIIDKFAGIINSDYKKHKKIQEILNGDLSK